MADGEDCSSSNLRLMITNHEELIRSRQNSRWTPLRTCNVYIAQIGEGQRDGALFNPECRLKFDNDGKLPYYNLRSFNQNDYCLANIALYDINEEEFSSPNLTTIRGTKMDNWSPLFHDTNMG